LLELYDMSVAIMRQNLRRRPPEATDPEIEGMLRRWLMKADQPISSELGASATGR
jgi:hypothetical protein